MDALSRAGISHRRHGVGSSGVGPVLGTHLARRGALHELSARLTPPRMFTADTTRRCHAISCLVGSVASRARRRPNRCLPGDGGSELVVLTLASSLERFDYGDAARHAFLSPKFAISEYPPGSLR